MIDSNSETYIIIKDFHLRQDQLVFDVPPESVSLQETKQHSKVFAEDRLVAKILNATKIDQDRNILFSGFDAFGL